MGTAVVHVKLVDGGFDWPAWIGAIASLVTVVLVAGTALIALRALHDAKRTRHGQLTLNLIQLWDDQRVIDSARDFRVWGSAGTTDLVETLWAKGVETRYHFKPRRKPSRARLLNNLPPVPALATSEIPRLLDNLVPPPREDEADYERDLATWYKLSIYPNLIDAIGVLERENALSVELIDELWGSNIVDAWNLWTQPVVRLRTLTEVEDVWSQFEGIADRLATYRERRTWSRRKKVSYRAYRVFSWLVLEPYPEDPTARSLARRSAT
jgi:hypothetical protein